MGRTGSAGCPAVQREFDKAAAPAHFTAMSDKVHRPLLGAGRQKPTIKVRHDQPLKVQLPAMKRCITLALQLYNMPEAHRSMW